MDPRNNLFDGFCGHFISHMKIISLEMCRFFTCLAAKYLMESKIIITKPNHALLFAVD